MKELFPDRLEPSVQGITESPSLELSYSKNSTQQRDPAPDHADKVPHGSPGQAKGKPQHLLLLA
jgi:hypothetical protein